MSKKVALVAQHISTLLTSHRLAMLQNKKRTPPLFIGVQGPQGIGKTTITNILIDTLAASPQPVTACMLSLDDFYLPYDGLVRVAEANPVNKLLSGRGQPGTHDIPALQNALAALASINEPNSGPVFLPVFDKSLREGKGDRALTGRTATGPIDVVVLEGWCMGFYPISPSKLRDVYDTILNSASPSERPEITLERDIIRNHSFEEFVQINEFLRSYATSIYSHFTGFVKLAPPDTQPYSLIYKWRLEQEHSMKARNGGRGMTDEQVKTFINRYIPGYIFFSEGVKNGFEPEDESEGVSSPPPWVGNGLRICLNKERDIDSFDLF